MFQGHQVRGSAASEIMSRAPHSQLGGQHYPGNMESAAERFLSPLFSSNDVLSDFRQVKQFFSKVILINLRARKSPVNVG